MTVAPATRLLNEFHDVLQETELRNGVVELLEPDHAVPEPTVRDPHVWRVRMLAVAGDRLVVEAPPRSEREARAAVEPGRTVRCVVTHGNSRWSFLCDVMDHTLHQLNAQQRLPAVRLSEPRDIRNAQRRSFFRVSTVGAHLPGVQVWPVFDLESCIAAEAANEASHRSQSETGTTPMPSLGQSFDADLLDIGGGGLAVGLDLNQEQTIENHGAFWLELNLPAVDQPLNVVASPLRITKDRPRSFMRVGMTFVFSHNPAHRRFIESKVCHYAAYEQRRRLQRQR